MNEEEGKKLLDAWADMVNASNENLNAVLNSMPRTPEVNNAAHYLTIATMFLERAFNQNDGMTIASHVNRIERRKAKKEQAANEQDNGQDGS